MARETLKNFVFVEAYAAEIFDINTHEMVGHESLIENFTINKSADKTSVTDPHGQELWSLYNNVQMTVNYDESLQSLLTISENLGTAPRFATASATVNRPVSETKTITTTGVTLAYTPVSAEDITVRVTTDDDPIGKLYHYDATAGDNTFTVTGKQIKFASGVKGTAMINYEKAMTKGAVVEASTDTEYPIRELHIYIKVKDVCTDETFSGVWVFYRVQKDVTSIDLDFAIDGKPSQSWNTMSNSLCNAEDKKIAAFFIDFEKDE